MLRRRIAWLLIIIAAAVLYLFDNGTPTLALLIACILAPLLSFGLLMLSGRHISIGLERLEIAEEYQVRLLISNSDLMPVSDIETQVRCTNLRTGEAERLAVTRSVRPKGKSEDIMTITPGHAGRYEISVESARIYDPLRLWSRNIPAEGSAYLTSLPDTFDMSLSVTSSSSSMPESDRHKDGRGGTDPGEVRDIREYIPGDPIKNIHWKLSSKTDKLLVRELGVPVTDQFLVILDNAADVGLNPDALDAIVSVFASILQSLCNDDMDFNACWTSPETGEPVLRRITCEEDLLAAADEYLAVPATTRSAFETIERGKIDSRFAHLIMTGSQIPVGLESITNGCQVTLLMYGSETEGRTDSGAMVIGFDENTYTSELVEIEI